MLAILPLLLASCMGESGTPEAASVETAPVETAGIDTVPSSVETAQTSVIRPVKSKEAKHLLAQGSLIVLDIRTPEEWSGGHLKGAQLLNIYEPEFSQRLQVLDRTKPYLVYCAVGGRSRKAAKMMQQLGFQQVCDATEGFTALKAAGVPVE